MLRHITIPNDVEVTDPITEEPVGQRLSFWQFLCSSVFRDQRWGVSYDDLAKMIEVRDAFKKAKAGEEVTLPEQHYKTVLACVEKPQLPNNSGYNPVLMSQCMSIFDCIRNARKE